MATAQRNPKSPPAGSVGTDGVPWNPFNVVADIQADLWANDKLSGAIEMALLLWIWRATWGKKDIEAEDKPAAYAPPTSMAKLAKQLNTSADLVFRAIKRLRQAGIIVTEPKDDKGGKPLQLKLTPLRWYAAPRYVPAGIVIEMPAPAAEPEPDPEEENQDQGVLDGMEHFFVERSKPAVIGVTRHLESLRIETPGGLDIHSRWAGTELVLTIDGRSEANKSITSKTSDLQVGGHKSRNTPAVEREALRAGLKLGGDVDMVERLYQQLRKAKGADAAAFVAFVDHKRRTRKAPIPRTYLPKIMAEFVATPADERTPAAANESFFERQYRELIEARRREAENG